MTQPIYPGTIDFSNTSVTAGTAPYNYSQGGWIAGGGYVSAPTAVTFNWNPAPNRQLLEDPEVLDKLISKMITLYKPDDPLVICVDFDVPQQNVEELRGMLESEGMKGVIVPGARAGSGMPIYRPIKPGHERIDILARIGEVWERKPDLTLTQLLSWWKGESMDDDEFAAATDVHFRKLFEDWEY